MYSNFITAGKNAYYFSPKGFSDSSFNDKYYRIFTNWSEEKKNLCKFINKKIISCKIYNDYPLLFNEPFTICQSNKTYNLMASTIIDKIGKDYNGDIGIMIHSNDDGSIQALEEHITNTDVTMGFNIYDFNDMYDRYDRSNTTYHKELISTGLENHFEMLQHDVEMFEQKKLFACKLGVSNTGRNYLLYGPPGNGKSTLVKDFVSKNGYCLYLTGQNLFFANAKLNPLKRNVNNINVILIEDFDKTPMEKKSETELLNAMNGIGKADDIIRFFTANDITKIVQNQALMSRFTRVFFLDNPSTANIITHLTKIFPKEISDIPNFINKLEEKSLIGKISFRNLDNFLYRYFTFDDTTIKTATVYIDNWVDELTHLDNSVANSDDKSQINNLVGKITSIIDKK